MEMKRIVMVCSGNICRSPMAEVLLKAALAEHGVDCIEVHSAGTCALTDLPAVDQSVYVCQEEGLDLSKHRSKPLALDVVRRADMVLVMEKRHLAEIVEALPEAEGKVRLLGSFAKGRGADDAEIKDPFGSSYGAFRQCFDEIKEAVAGLAEYLQTN